MDKHSHIALVSMPFGALERPALGISTLKPFLEDQYNCDVLYLNFPFADFLGYEVYNWISLELPYTAFTGDWIFTRPLYGKNRQAEQRYIDNILRGAWQLSESEINRISHAMDLTDHYFEYCLAAYPWEKYSIIGFTSTFEQNIASLAMAKKIKEKYPGVTTIFGGANWEEEMGLELHRRFSFVDFVCSGEAERSFPAVVEGLFSKKPALSYSSIPGIVFRNNGVSTYTGPPDYLHELDDLPIPDYTDYFSQLTLCATAVPVTPVLLIETSRGCWWGSRSQCTFCGLNGGKISFRSKSPKRALDEIDLLTSRWQTDFIQAADNILNMSYFETLLPELAKKTEPVQIFYETKANLSRKHVRMLGKAGVSRIQPGIESLNDNVLKLMKKGTSALKNIQLLKWCREFGVSVDWNIIYGFPNEKKEDYVEMLELLKAVRFLGPPTGYGPVRLDRFSPFFSAAEENGFIDVRPLEPYSYLYPFDMESLGKIAYAFNYNYKQAVDPTGFADEVVKFIIEWKRTPETGTLSFTLESDGTMVLSDTRSDAIVKRRVFSGLERVVYRFFAEMNTAENLMKQLQRQPCGKRIKEAEISGIMNRFVENRLMVKDGANYLSLAIPGSAEHRLDV